MAKEKQLHPSADQAQIEKEQGLKATLKIEKRRFLATVNARNLTASETIKSAAQGIEALTATIKAQPTAAAAFYQRGRCYALLSKHEEAVQDFSQSITLDTQSYHIYEAKNDPDYHPAMQKMQRSLAQSHLSRAKSYKALGHDAQALIDNDIAHTLRQSELASKLSAPKFPAVKESKPAAVRASKHHAPHRAAEPWSNRAYAHTPLLGRHADQVRQAQALRKDNSCVVM